MLVSFQQFKSNDKLCNINISKIVEFIGSVKNGNNIYNIKTLKSY